MDSIIVNPNNAHQVYAGTDWGVYYTDDISVASPTWQRFENGIPHAMVWDMQIDRGSTTLSVWTRSRGAYVYPLPGGGGSPTPTPYRIANCYTYCYGDGNHNTDRNTFGNANPHLPGDLYDSYCHWQDNRRRHRYRQPLRRLQHACRSTLPGKRIRHSDFSGVCRVERHVQFTGPTTTVLLVRSACR